MMHGTSAQRKLGFRIHAITFAVALPILVIINLLTGAPYWVLWVFAGWGIGLLSHWLFGTGPAGGTQGTP